MLGDIAEFDRTEAWRGDGSLSMRDWLVARCHVSRARARTLVEAAQKVKELPALSDALSDGRLTLDVFAPLAAVATPETDADLAQAAEHWTPKQARQMVAEVKGSTDAEAAAQFRRRFVRFDDERCMLWAQLTGDAYALVKSAVLGRARRHDHPSASDPDYVRFESRCADALLDICIEQGRTQGRAGRVGRAGPRRRPDDDGRAHGPRAPPLRRRVRSRLHRRRRPDLGRGGAPAGLQRRHHPVVRRRPMAAASTRSSCSETRARPSGSRSGAGTTVAVSRLRLPERDRRPSRRLGLQAGAHGHVEPSDPLRCPSQPGARARLEVGR